jgi:hypothetical protein
VLLELVPHPLNRQAWPVILYTIPVQLALQATQGEGWIPALKRWNLYVDPCYKLYPDVIEQIKMETVHAPTMEVRCTYPYVWHA